MLPVIEGIIARRILLNFTVDPEVAQALLPKPLKIEIVGGRALVGVCLIRLEKVRPKGMPKFVGLSSENMAHRFAIKFSGTGKEEHGVFVARRNTDSAFVTLFGGRLFPGYHHSADFLVNETETGIEMKIKTEDDAADVYLKAIWTKKWQGSSVFENLEEASEFFRRAPCGFSFGRDGCTLEGLKLHAIDWHIDPLQVEKVSACYYQDLKRFPKGSIEFDHALVMRAVPHEWHELKDVPELAGNFAGS